MAPGPALPSPGPMPHTFPGLAFIFTEPSLSSCCAHPRTHEERRTSAAPAIASAQQSSSQSLVSTASKSLPLPRAATPQAFLHHLEQPLPSPCPLSPIPTPSYPQPYTCPSQNLLITYTGSLIVLILIPSHHPSQNPPVSSSTPSHPTTLSHCLCWYPPITHPSTIPLYWQLCSTASPNTMHHP